MESRFGLKDVLVLALLLLIGGAVVLSMVQEDRRWSEIRDLRAGVNEQTRILANIQRGLEPPSASGAAARPAPPDDSWALPGVPVTRPAPYDWASDPTAEPGYSEGGTLTEILEGTPAKLTPYTVNDTYSARIVNDLVCEHLAAFDQRTLEPRGLLAEAWQLDPGGAWLRVKINDRARFSDGTPVTAEDVRFTFMDYVLNSQIDAEVFRSEIRAIRSVSVINDKAVEFRFEEPRFNNLTAALRNPILPAHFYKGFTPSQINQSTGLLMGSGPYKLASVDPDNQWKPPTPVLLVRNDLYWGRRSPIDRLRFTFVGDNTARLTAYENGEGDLVRATPEQYRAKSRDPAFTARHQALAWTNMRSGYTMIAWNCGERSGKPTPFADARVRLAMTLLLDRERINRDFYEGLAGVATCSLPPSQADPGVKPWPCDPARAKELLALAGWMDRDANGVLENERGEEFTFEYTYASAGSFGERVGHYLLDQCASVGVRCILGKADWTTMSAQQKSRDFDAMILTYTWSNPESDPFQTFHSSQIGNQGDNWIQWSNPKADALIDRARRTIDRDRRMALWHEFQRVVHEDQPCTFLLNVPWIRFVNARVRNVHTYPTTLDRREMYLTRAAQ